MTLDARVLGLVAIAVTACTTGGTGVPNAVAPDARAPDTCVTSADCTGSFCLFAIDAGCGAVGRCVDAPAPIAGCSTETTCACDGTTYQESVCWPAGLASRPVASAGRCAGYPLCPSGCTQVASAGIPCAPPLDQCNCVGATTSLDAGNCPYGDVGLDDAGGFPILCCD